ELTVVPGEDEEMGAGARPLSWSEPLAIHEHIHDTLTRMVWDWPVWNRLLLSILRGGPVQGRRRGPQNAMDEEEAEAQEDGLPSSSRDLRDLFQGTVAEGEHFARDCVRRAIPRLLNEIGARTRTHLDRLRSLLDDPEIDERLREFDRARPATPGRRS